MPFSLFSHNRVNILLYLTLPLSQNQAQNKTDPLHLQPPPPLRKKYKKDLQFPNKNASYQVYIVPILHVHTKFNVHTKFTCSYQVYMFVYQVYMLPSLHVNTKFTCSYQVYMFIPSLHVRHETLFNQSINTCSYRVYMFILVLYIHPTKMSDVLP